jgi:hypothetical protein
MWRWFCTSFTCYALGSLSPFHLPN